MPDSTRWRAGAVAEVLGATAELVAEEAVVFMRRPWGAAPAAGERGVVAAVMAAETQDGRGL
jgi:hypothetical protein